MVKLHNFDSNFISDFCTLFHDPSRGFLILSPNGAIKISQNHEEFHNKNYYKGYSCTILKYLKLHFKVKILFQNERNYFQ